MPKRMLIDTSHPEETRVVISDNNKVQEFDFEAASKRPLKGNIYLAKITRVEPSLQAAFVEYGGNRQGFLAFSEIHPDYYQIPVADRLALIADQSRRLMAEDDEVDAVNTAMGPSKDVMPVSDETAGDAMSTEVDDGGMQTSTESDAQTHEVDEEDDPSDPIPVSGSAAPEGSAEPDQESETQDEVLATEETGTDAESNPEAEYDTDGGGDAENGAEPATNAEDATEAAPQNGTVVAEATGAPAENGRARKSSRPPRRRHYKIQEVIRRKQIILIQVVKEERGNKGASLTTYLSLAGRYCVLMPNTPRGGGISRKITSLTDRRRLKSAAQSLELPEGMGLIIRTAGANRTKAEIKRDYEYLLRLWDSVRDLTLKSNAPALVYEEGNLIKRSIRDLYDKDISEVLVEGESGYRDAKDFMRMLMPSHAKNVKLYKEPLPLFQSQHVEAQLDAMFSPTVTLKSGGYIVINQTEALVAVDVNSGRATREHSIEETAHKTNLEAADEVGRQLRLRDLAGLIVIDFIDMEEPKNNRNVEKRLRDAIHGDRARVQIGRISQFGLLEMSRQRLRAGVMAGSTVTCPHCEGLGLVRSTESAALRLLRMLDEQGQQQASADIVIKAPEDIAIFTLNNKRQEIARIEDAYDLSVRFETKADMAGGSFEIERVGLRKPSAPPKSAVVTVTTHAHEDEDEDEDEINAAQEDVTIVEAPAATGGDGQPQSSEDAAANGKKRRRRRRRGGRGRGPAQSEADTVPQDAAPPEERQESAGEDAPAAGAAPTVRGGEKRRRRRRGGRGGNRAAQQREGETNTSEAAAPAGNPTAPQEDRAETPNRPEIASMGTAPVSTPPGPVPTGGGDVLPLTELSKPFPPATAREEQAEEPQRAEQDRKGWWQKRLGI